MDYANSIAPEIAAGLDMADLGLSSSVETDMVRSGFVPDTPPNFIETVFATDEGAVDVLAGDGTAIIFRVHAVSEPSAGDEDTLALRQLLSQQLAQSYAQNIYGVFSAGVVANTDIDLNQQLINGLHAQIQ